MLHKESIPVAILGATGAVGQKAIAMLEGHPFLYVNEVAASEKSAGKIFGQAVRWIEASPLENRIRNLRIKRASELQSRYILSSIPSTEAKEIESNLAEKGKWVFSNASAHRMDPAVPLLIPEVNIHHLDLLKKQSTEGKRITNSNCVVVFVALALAPLLELGEIDSLGVVTLQGISGAGINGLSAYQILGNIIPYIAYEEEKITREIQKILSKTFFIQPQVFRVPVLHGHTMCLQIKFTSPINVSDVLALYRDKEKELPNAYKIWEDVLSPQPARDLSSFDQRAHIGQIKQHSKFHLSLVVTGHNLVRGAAGAAIRNLEATLEFIGMQNG